MRKLIALMILCLLPQLALAKLKCPPLSERFKYDRIILDAAKKHKVDAALVHAVIKQESCYNLLAVSHAGAEGLMQLIPATAKRFNVTNSFIAKQNINGGTKYLAWLLKRFKGNISFALAGYNAGEGKVDRYKGIPPYKETQKYVKRVTAFYRQFKGIKAKPEHKKRYSGLEGRLRKTNDKTPSGLTFNRNNLTKKSSGRIKNIASLAISAPTIQGKRIRVRSSTLSKVKHQRKGYTRVYSRQNTRVRHPHAS